MDFIQQIIGAPLGQIMSLSYRIFENYGIAIIVFTFITRIILLPVSLWIHKNSIKMVKILPEINHIKRKYYGDNNRIADEQSNIYKREKYNPLASIVPLILQIILLIGVIHVIYHPLDFLLKLDPVLITGLIEKTVELTGINPETSSVQLIIVEAIKDPALSKQFLSMQAEFPSLNITDILTNIRALKMDFLGINLGWVPAVEKGFLYSVPLIAGFSAWLLAFTQNNINVLQSEQGKFNKYFTMALSVGLSLYLGLFVPVGVALYWISSNTMAMIKVLILNKVIDPRKFVDYDALASSKKELLDLQNLEKKSVTIQSDKNKKREKADYKRFFSIANKHLVFYSEGSGYYKYYKQVINEILNRSNIIIHYITNDPDDQVFEIALNQHRIKPYYISMKRLITLMMRMDAEIVVMTTPDLENYHIKRSYIEKDIEYIYMPHSPGGSYSKTLRKGALDHFDTVFLTGPQAKREIRALEKVYNQPEKNLVEFGFPLLEDLAQKYEASEKEINEKKVILIAPSWHDGNIMECCIETILKTLVNDKYKIIVRPHPQYTRLYSEKVAKIQNEFSSVPSSNLVFETDFSSSSSIYQSDIIITDWSGIGYEFCFATLKPGIFVNTKRKIANPESDRVDLESLEDRIRKQLGIELELNEIAGIDENIRFLIENEAVFQDKIRTVRNDELYNFGYAAQKGAEYITKSLVARSNNKANVL
ncbi:MAG: Membrane protein insertase YidC [Firmicutes bacterium ADurb.Bin419]|nr:MAG: Membrane protein insertase YidC [Firmicutes bacterium ADurb.Bin419]